MTTMGRGRKVQEFKLKVLYTVEGELTTTGMGHFCKSKLFAMLSNVGDEYCRRQWNLTQ